MPDCRCPLCGKDAKLLDRYPQHTRKGINAIGCARCGEYFATIEAVDELRVLDRNPLEKAMLSWVTRERFEEHRPITICTSGYDPQGTEPIGVRIDEVLDTLVPRSIPQRMDRALLNLGRKSRHPGDSVLVGPDTDYPLLFAENPLAAEFTLKHMVLSGLLEQSISYDQGGGKYVLTVEGWAKTDQLTGVRPDSRQGFVAMCFASELDELYDKGLKPAIEDAGYYAMRVDRQEFNDRIDDQIIVEIRRSRFLVADFTKQRPAVYYEAGFAQALGLPVICTCHKNDLDKCSFDTRQYKHIVWEWPEQLREQLTNRIRATIV